jgi:regulator of replication initiation timing
MQRFFLNGNVLSHSLIF